MLFRNRERDVKVIKLFKIKIYVKLGVCFRGGIRGGGREIDGFMMNFEDGFGFVNNVFNILFL